MARRTAIGVAIGLVLFAGARLLFDGDTPTGDGDLVSFTGSDRGEGVPAPPTDRQVTAAAREVRDLLDEWYQQAFADPTRYGDASFDDIGRRFFGEAAVGFLEDREVLTIGSFAPRIREIRVDLDRANVTVYAEAGEVRFATGAVRFRALARIADDNRPVEIIQRVNIVLERKPDLGWVVTNYYDARQQRRAIVEEAE